jgi:AhpD family alkylhydroperoxidase
MHHRLQPFAAAPDAVRALMGLEQYVKESGLDAKLIHLVKLRSSQINGCAFCVDMHVKEAIDDGEDAQKLHLLSVWRESPLFDEKERVVLAWTEALTDLPGHPVDDALYNSAVEIFGEADLVRLSVAVGAINAWNRLGVPFQMRHPRGMAARVRG